MGRDDKIIKNAEVYSPEYIGKKDILIADSRIAKIGASVDIDGLALGRVMVEDKIAVVKGTFEK